MNKTESICLVFVTLPTLLWFAATKSLECTWGDIPFDYNGCKYYGEYFGSIVESCMFWVTITLPVAVFVIPAQFIQLLAFTVKKIAKTVKSHGQKFT